MITKSTILAATLLGLSAIASPGLSGGALAAGSADMAVIPTDMLAASAFGVSVGTGRGVRVSTGRGVRLGVGVGRSKVLDQRRVVRRSY